MSLLDDPLIDEKEAARLLSLSAAMMRKWRGNGGGPKYFKVGGTAVRYRKSDLIKFLDQSAKDTVMKAVGK